jgi:hypothetical protein
MRPMRSFTPKQVGEKRQDSIGAAPRDQACAIDGERVEQVG